MLDVSRRENNKYPLVCISASTIITPLARPWAPTGGVCFRLNHLQVPSPSWPGVPHVPSIQHSSTCGVESHWNPIGLSLEVCSPTRRRCLTTLQCAESPSSSSAPAQRMFSCDQMYRYPVWILLTPHSIAGAQPLVARSIAHPVRCRRAEHACRLAWSLCPMTPLLLSAQLASSSV